MPGSGTRSSSLVLRSSLRFMNRHRWQSWLTFIGVMLGVTMVVGVDLANSSARRAFSLSLESIAGSATHQIVGGPRGIPDSVYTRLRTELAIRSSLPMVIGQVTIKGKNFSLLGVDPIPEMDLGRHMAGLETHGLSRALLDDNAVMLSRRAADKLELQISEVFELRTGGRTFMVRLVAIFPSANPAATEGLLFADIAVAQRLLNRFGRLDRIDLILNESDRKELQAWLPAGLGLVASELRNDSLVQMSEAFHINLTAMSLLALLVAALLIYNTVTLSVLQRRNTLGIFRALGVTRNEIFILILRESLVLATLASLAGLVMGLLLGQALVQLVTRTVNDLYFNLHVTAFLIDPVSLLKGFLMGLGMSVVASSIPAWEASRSRPANVMQRSTVERRWQLRLPMLTTLGVVCLISGLLIVERTHGPLVEGFFALTLIVFGFCFMVPGMVVLMTRLLLRILSPLLGSTARIAIRDINAGISRTGMAVAALTVAVSVTVGVGVMVSSFRETVSVWLGQYLSGDIYVSTLDSNGSGLTPALKSRFQALAGVASVAPSRIENIETEFGPVRLIALTPTENDTRLPLKQSVEGVAELFYQGKGILISEPLAYHQQLGPGDSITVLAAKGEQQLRILGVYYDYTTSRGMIAVHREAYRQIWNDERISGFTIYKEGNADQGKLLDAVREVLTSEAEQIRVSSNQEIRETAMAVFDRTFAITHVLRLLAILVAFVGVLSALMALQLERTREFAILRATGMTPRQISVMILGQTGLMGLLAGLLSIPLGLLMADILIDVINQRSFGWSMQHRLPAGVLAEAVFLAVIAAVLAGVYPALKAASISPAQALREE